MSTSGRLNQRGVVIICIIIHCDNGFRKPLLLKMCLRFFLAHYLNTNVTSVS